MPEILKTSATLTPRERLRHILARCGIGRMRMRVQPGLYALGRPGRDADVFVTANYQLSFDALRSALAGRDAWLLVLETYGINVWCAAGKGTFGTDELVKAVQFSGLAGAVEHRRLILPQLGATGVSAHLVRERCSFEVEYGPVLASDLPEYLKNHMATPQMRRVRFNLADRMVLAPVEVVSTLLPAAGIAIALYLLGGWFHALWFACAWLAAIAGFLALLPLLPGREFSVKGLILGGAISLPFIIWQLLQPGTPLAQDLLRILPPALIFSAAVAYYTLNLTGSTPITCWTSVKREIARYIPLIAGMTGAGVLLQIVRLLGFGK